MGGLQCAASKGPWRSTKLRRLPSLQHTHSIGTDGLTDDAATHSLLQALAAAGDLCPKPTRTPPPPRVI